MDQKSFENTLLISIKPEYARRILNGEKKIEFRKSSIRSNITHAVIYATAPVKMLVGTFQIEGVDKSSPEDLWNRYHDVGGIEKTDYDEYYRNRKSAAGILIKNAKKLNDPASLEVLGLGKTPPQSFRYINNTSLNILLKK